MFIGWINSQRFKQGTFGKLVFSARLYKARFGKGFSCKQHPWDKHRLHFLRPSLYRMPKKMSVAYLLFCLFLIPHTSINSLFDSMQQSFVKFLLCARKCWGDVVGRNTKLESSKESTYQFSGKD